MTVASRSGVRLLVAATILGAIACVGFLSAHRPGTRIWILHDYWAQTRVDTASTLAALDAARSEPPLAVPVGQYTTTDRIDLGDRALKSRFDLRLTDTGTFTAERTTTIGRDQDDRVFVRGRYRVVGRAVEFTPDEGPVGLYPVDGASLVMLQEDGTLVMTAGDHSIALRLVATR